MNDEDLDKEYTLTLDGGDLEELIRLVNEHIEYWTNELVARASEVRKRRMHTDSQREANINSLAEAELNVQSARKLRAKLQSAKHQEPSIWSSDNPDLAPGRDPRQTSTPDNVLHDRCGVQWTTDDADIAEAEGWALFETDKGALEAQIEDDASLSRLHANDKRLYADLARHAINHDDTTARKALAITLLGWVQTEQ